MSKSSIFIEVGEIVVDLNEDVIGAELLEILLKDHTTENNIIWATDTYSHLGDNYSFFSPILIDNITGEHNLVIRPRHKKEAEAASPSALHDGSAVKDSELLLKNPSLIPPPHWPKPSR